MSHIQYFERDYCDDCMDIHWVELTRYRKIICHGHNYIPHDTATHYTRRMGRGVEIVPYTRPRSMPLDWQLTMQLADQRETIDQNQDW